MAYALMLFGNLLKGIEDYGGGFVSLGYVYVGSQYHCCMQVWHHLIKVIIMVGMVVDLQLCCYV